MNIIYIAAISELRN